MTAKTHELFECRGIDMFLNACCLRSDEIAKIRDQVGNLQDKIYALDAYGEDHWEIQPAQLENLCGDIRMAITRFGLSVSEASDWMAEIKMYANCELGIRKGVTLDTLDLWKHYWLKSCDVRLARRLTGKLARVSERELTFVWTEFDLLTEILDDVDDVMEDEYTYNGNRWLACIKADKTSAVRQYESAIEGIEAAFRKKESTRNFRHSPLAYDIQKKFWVSISRLRAAIGASLTIETLFVTRGKRERQILRR